MRERCLHGRPRRGRSRAQVRASILVTFSLLLPLACERKAPGPDECRHAALHVLGLEGLDWQRSTRARMAVDQFMVECLTTPFDRTFTRCLEERGIRSCSLELERRRIGDPIED